MTDIDSGGGREFSEGYDKLKLESYPERCIAADDYTLQIDIDSEEDLTYCRRTVARFKEDLAKHNLIHIEDVIVSPSRKPGHYHVTVKLYSPLSVFQRIFYQAVFGSDRVRELRNWGRAEKGMKDPVLFIVHENQDGS